MTVEERLAIVETEMKALKSLTQGMANDVAELKNLTAMGRGVFLMLARFGMYAAGAVAIVQWISEHWGKLLGR